MALLPTPLTPAPRLATALGLTAPLWVKRDDLTGFAVAGNKARQLELLVDDARTRGADVLITGGTLGSNFVQAAAAAAAWADLGCVLVLAGPPVPHSAHPNLAAATAWGADVRFTGDLDRTTVDAQLPVVAAELTAAGCRPYVVPRGGASPVGAEGYRLAVDEVLAQLDGQAPVVVIAAGAGGTLAGLVAGNVALGRPLRIVGASVSRPPAEVTARVLELAGQVADRRGEPRPGESDVELVDARGPGHGVASPAGDAAAALALRAAGLVLDPVYTAKALAALPTAAEGQPALFWHTGGLLDAVAGLMGDRT
ncbi:MAG TPA: pyridoxal-phosphate dependent enzyme [Modestobacter sp.]|jgi:D-cysteine desulfhydrase|nr:pyridoxal-phosphate dependent enzyme [Modestobacter sp.]